VDRTRIRGEETRAELKLANMLHEVCHGNGIVEVMLEMTTLGVKTSASPGVSEGLSASYGQAFCTECRITDAGHRPT
jgi:hypothetical protein